MGIMQSKPSRKQLSHERIVDVASRAIRRAGAHGVGLADMMKEAGLTHGGFYAHFESRDALVMEAIQHAGQENIAALEAALSRRPRQGGGRFATLVRAYLHESQLECAESGCVVAALASEMPRLNEGLRVEARHRIAALVELVRSTLPEGTAPQEADVVASMLVGALQMARAYGNEGGRELLARARDRIIAQFEPLPSR